MDSTTVLLAGPFTPADILAAAALLVAWLGAGRVIEHPPARLPSVSVLMREYRREWMRQFITRQPRIFDGNILTTLREGTAFFASACLIAIGGGLALIGNPEQISRLAGQFDMAHVPALMWEIKIVVVLFFVANALLRFIWAHRLFGYCAILMAAVPNEVDHPEAMSRAMQAAQINITAAKSFNSGLRCVYFGLGAIGWLAGPGVLALSTAAVLGVTLRREFASDSRRAIMGRRP